MKQFDRIYIEISNICNLQCDFCPEVLRSKKIMPIELFRTVLPQVKPLTKEITFHLMGEPLAHPYFEQFVQAVEEFQIPVNLTTNGTLLYLKENDKLLLNPIFRQVNFSLQSATANFKPTTSVSEKEEHLKKYLESIFDWTEFAFTERPDLYINYRLWNVGSPDELEQANQQFLKPIEKRFSVPLNPSVDVSFQKSKRVTNRLYLHFDSRFDWPSFNLPHQGDQGFCYALQNHFAIHADGVVVPCCLDKEANINLGQITVEDTNGLRDILTSERARKIVSGFQNHKRCEPFCQHCSYINRFESKIKPSTRAPSLSHPSQFRSS